MRRRLLPVMWLALLTACAPSAAMPTPSATSTPTQATTPPVSPTSAVDGLATCWSAAPSARGPADLTGSLGIESALTGMMAHAVAAGDVNNDGWTDLFVGSFADRPAPEYAFRGADGPGPDRLLLGSPTGYQNDVSFPAVRGRSSGAAFADLDGDRDLDLVISRQPRGTERGSAPSVVLRNDGGHFTEAFVLDRTRGGRAVGVLDVDADGRPDLVLVEDKWTGSSSAVFHNDGNLTFSDVTAKVGLPTDVFGLGLATDDLDGDHLPDLFVAGSNRLFLNAGGKFVEQQTGSVFRWAAAGNEDDIAGVAVGDLNRDGRPDLVIGQHYNSTLEGGPPVPVRVYLNRGPGSGDRVRFEDVTQAAGIPPLPTKAPHVEVVDIDADGWPDILTSAGGPDGSAPVTLRNTTKTGDQLAFTATVPPGSRQYWVTGAVLDADHDGALDVLLAEWYPSKPSVLRRLGDAANWLAVDIGPAGSGGLGAVVSVYPAGSLGDDAQLLGRREITATTGYAAGGEPVARFGLGQASSVDVEIRLPGGAAPLEFRGVSANQFVRAQGRCA